MEKQGLIKSDWIIEDNSRARRYYTILNKGLGKMDELREDWQLLCTIIDKLLIDAGAEPITFSI